MTPSATAITAAVKSLAARRGVTLTSVAEASDMSLPVLSKRLAASDGPNSQLRLLTTVADALGVTLRNLLAEAEACQEAVNDV
jgi:transcriptional regulator with XRE-family HTH domain